jgi:hypothetical protein
MTIGQINRRGNKIRRPNWEVGQYLEIFNESGYVGTDFGFSPEHYGPSGLLTNKEGGRHPWWIPGSHSATDWEII